MLTTTDEQSTEIEVQEEKNAYESLPEQWKGWLNEYLLTLKPSTQSVYKNIIANFLNKINNVMNPLILQQYSADKWEAFVQEHYTGIQSRTIRVKSHAVKSFFDFLIKEGKIKRSTNPLNGYAMPKNVTGNNNRFHLTWGQIQTLKTNKDIRKRNIFEAAYYNKMSIAEIKEKLGYDGSTVDLYVKKMGKEINMEKLKYSDITAAHNTYFTKCPVTGKELEMIEDNWTFRGGLLQAKEL